MNYMRFSYRGKVVEADVETISRWMSPDDARVKPSIEFIDLSDPDQYEAIVDLVFSKNGENFWTQTEIDEISKMNDGVYNSHIVIRNKWDPIAYLKNLHTRQIMDLRNACYRYGHDMVDVSDCGQGPDITIDQIKEVLATREHIPNKKEAKVIRQQKAKARR